MQRVHGTNAKAAFCSLAFARRSQLLLDRSVAPVGPVALPLLSSRRDILYRGCILDEKPVDGDQRAPCQLSSARSTVYIERGRIVSAGPVNEASARSKVRVEEEIRS